MEFLPHADPSSQSEPCRTPCPPAQPPARQPKNTKRTHLPLCSQQIFQERTHLEPVQWLRSAPPSRPSTGLAYTCQHHEILASRRCLDTCPHRRPVLANCPPKWG